MSRTIRPAGRLGRTAAAIAVTVTALASWPAGPAGGQTPPPPPAYRLSLTAQTGWVSTATNGTFHMGVAAASPDPRATRLSVTVYQRLTSRSDFDESVAGRIHTSVRHAFQASPLSSLSTDSSGAFPIDIPVNSSPSISGRDFLRLVTPGIYPVEVRLIDSDGTTDVRLITHLVYEGDTTATSPRLDVAWVLPVHAPPALTADHRPDRLPAASVQPIADLASALVQHPEVPVTLTPTAQTLDALASGSEGDKATLTAVAALVARTTAAETVEHPYTALNLPSLVAAGLDAEISAQLRRADQVLAATLQSRPNPRTWVEGGPFNLNALDLVIDRGVDRLVVNENVLNPLAPDLRNTTLAQPFWLRGRGDRRVQVVAGDPGLAAHFTEGGDQVLAAHQLLADLAMIQSERPANPRGVAILTPTAWRADRTFLAEVLDGLSSSPVLAPVTVDQLFTDVPVAQVRRSPLERTLSEKQPIVPLANAAAIRAVRHRLDGLSSMLPADSTLYSDLERPLLLSQSDDLSDRDRILLTTAVNRLIDKQAAMIRLPANTSITLTARQGLFPVSILSTAAYPPRVLIRLSSQKLEFRPIQEPGASCTALGTSETCTLDLHAQNTTLKVPVVARTAGVFSVTISLVSPDGVLTLATSEDTVRSTAASGVGIFLSIGAALLLVVWWARDLRHGRRARGLVPAAPGSSPWDDDLEDLEAPGREQEPDGDDCLVGEVAPVSRAGATSAAVLAGPPVAPPRWGAPDRGMRTPIAPHRRTDPPEPPNTLTAVPDEPPPIPPSVIPPAGPAANGDGPLSASFSRNTAVMASGTVLSRLTGFARVLALVYAFRLTRLADVYNLANTAPNILYDLILGGVLSATLVPVFVDWFGRDNDEGWRAVSAVATAITVTLLALSALFWLAAPLIIRLYLVLDHSAGGADQRALGTTLLRLFAPQLLLLGGIALTTAMLNARRHFFAPAYSPVINNLITIGAIIAARMVAGSLELSSFRRDTAAVLILGLGTTGGYLLQLAVQLPPLIRGGWRLRPVWDLHHPAVRTVLRLSMWTFGAVIANQIAFNLVLILAARKAGDVTAFQTAFQFFQLPYAIFAVSIAAVITPDLSDRWARGDVGGFRQQLAAGLRLTLAVIVPGAVGYVLLARPAITLFVRHGGVGGSASHLIGTVVALFAVGLPGFSAYLLLMRGYQAMQDTKSMFWLYAFENALTIALALILYPIMGVGGLALGWVAAYTLAAVAAFIHLRSRTGGLEGRATALACARIGVATAVMAGVVFAILKVGDGPSRLAAPRLALAVAAGAAIYFLAGRVLGLDDLPTLGQFRSRSR